MSLPLDHDTLRNLYLGSRSTRYVYAIDLRVDATVTPACAAYQRHRWAKGICSGANYALSANTIVALQNSFEYYEHTIANTNKFLVEFVFGGGCDFADSFKVGFEITYKGVCYKHVHPEYFVSSVEQFLCFISCFCLNLRPHTKLRQDVYDMTHWTQDDTHPGNSPARNPIKEFAQRSESILRFPASHELSRWNLNKASFTRLGRWGDSITFAKLPEIFHTKNVADQFGAALPVSSKSGIMVCGSPGEIANNLFVGGEAGTGSGFDAITLQHKTRIILSFQNSRRETWTTISMTAKDQLRQRVAWVLAQILVISPGSLDTATDQSESWVTYYDIFIRNAFGNYRDVLKEVSYAPMMAEVRSHVFFWLVLYRLVVIADPQNSYCTLDAHIRG